MPGDTNTLRFLHVFECLIQPHVSTSVPLQQSSVSLVLHTFCLILLQYADVLLLFLLSSSSLLLFLLILLHLRLYVIFKRVYCNYKVL